MQYEQKLVQPLMTCIQAWNGRSRRAARLPLKCGPSSKKPAGPASAGSTAACSSSGSRCRFCGPSAPSTNGKRAKKPACSACGRQPVTSTTRAGSSRLSLAAVPRWPARRSSALLRTVHVL